MVKYRDALKIIADILNAAGSGSKKTRIMYVANLSYGLLEKYLKKTVHVGLLRVSDEGYAVSDKGRAFLEKYNAFSKTYSKLDTKLKNVLFEREILRRMCEPLETEELRVTSGRRRRK